MWFYVVFVKRKTNPIKVYPERSRIGQIKSTPRTAGGLKTNLKKQSQFSKGQRNISSCFKGDYEEFCPFGRRKNKAKQSQSKLAPSNAGG